MKDHAQRARLVTLIAAELNGTATADSHAELQRLLDSSSEARRFYIDHLDLQSALAWEHVGIAAGSMDVTGEFASESAGVKRASSFMGSIRRAPLRSLAASILAVAAIYYGLFVAITWNLWGDSLKKPRHQSPRADELATVDPETADRVVVARISQVKSAEFAEGVAYRSGDGLAAGESVELLSGMLGIAFLDGARCELAGPARFVIQDKDRGQLDAGRLLARVPERARGFTICTAEATIVDLGTEFAVAIDPRGTTDVHVFDGKVDVQPNSPNAEPMAPIRLLAGDARRISKPAKNAPPTIETLALDAAGYAQLQASARRISPLERWHDASAQLRNDPSLVVYYDFESRGTTLPNVLINALHGKVESVGKPPWTNGRWNGKGALAFGEQFASVSVPDDLTLQPASEWSVAVWFRLDMPPKGAVQILGKGSEPARSYSLWLMNSPVGPALHASIYTPDGVNRSVTSSEPTLVNRWNFAVATIEAGTLRLYLNGIATGEPLPLEGTPANSEESLLIGRSNEPQYPTPFTGAIDELSIFRRALSATEVEQFFQTGKPE